MQQIFLFQLSEFHFFSPAKTFLFYTFFRQLSTHRPDIALAVLSIAGWTSKESYGESNVFFRHDISISHTDPSVKHIMESCIAENDADKHSSNLKVKHSLSAQTRRF